MIIRIFFALILLIMPSQAALAGQVCQDEASGMRRLLGEMVEVHGGVVMVSPQSMPTFLLSLNSRARSGVYSGDSAMILIDPKSGGILYLHHPGPGALLCRVDPHDLRNEPPARFAPEVPA